MRKNEKGSSLIFALAVIMILTTVIAACMAIAYSYYNRSIVANSERQAYLTAKSVLTNVVEQITDNTCENHAEYLKMIPDESVTTMQTYDVTFNEEQKQKLGVVDSINAIRTKNKEKDENGNDVIIDKLTFTVKATFGKSTRTINADLKKYENESDDSWALSRYYEGNIVTETENQKNYRELTDKQNILYEYISGWSTKDNATKQSIVNEIKNGELKNIFDKATENAKNNDDSIDFRDVTVKNSNLQKIVYYGYFNGSWPVFNFDETSLTTDKNAPLTERIPADTYYLKIYFSELYYDRALIYANPNDKATGVFNDVKVVYYDGHWYYNYKKPLSITQLTGNNKEDLDAKYKKYLTGIDGGTDTDNKEAWLRDVNTIMIE